MPTFTFPFNYLQAAVITSSKDDIRYYFRGVCVRAGSIYSTDGPRATIIRCPAVADCPEIIIPRESVVEFLRRFKAAVPAKIRDHRQVALTVSTPRVVDEKTGDCTPAGPARLELDGAPNVAIDFDPINHKYPDVDSIIPTHEEATPAQYNWRYMADFCDVVVALGAPKNTTVVLTPGGTGAGRVTQPHYPQFLGVIMPVDTGYRPNLKQE